MLADRYTEARKLQASPFIQKPRYTAKPFQSTSTSNTPSGNSTKSGNQVSAKSDEPSHGMLNTKRYCICNKKRTLNK